MPLKLIMVNGAWPSAGISIAYGDRVIVTVLNKLDVPISLHYHGLIQREEGTMDGLAGGTQRCAQAGAGRGRGRKGPPRGRAGEGAAAWIGQHSC